MRRPIPDRWLALSRVERRPDDDESMDYCVSIPPCAEPFEFVTVYVDRHHPQLNIPAAEARRLYQRPVAEIQVSNRITVGPDLKPQAGLWIEGSRMLGFHPVWARRLRHCDLSPDWRRIDGRMTMIAVLALPPGRWYRTRTWWHRRAARRWTPA